MTYGILTQKYTKLRVSRFILICEKYAEGKIQVRSLEVAYTSSHNRNADAMEVTHLVEKGKLHLRHVQIFW